MAKTVDLKDGDARLAWKNLTNCYAPQGFTDLIHLTGEFNNCVLESPSEDPDVWFIKLETIRSRLSCIDVKYAKADYEVVAHIVNKLPEEYSELVTLVEGMTTTITLVKLKSKIRTFSTRKLKDSKSSNEIALLIINKSFTGICRKCGKQGHKAADCRSRDVTTNKNVKCFNCNRYAGHIARDCPEPKRQPKQQQQQHKSNESGMFVGMADKANKANVTTNETSSKPKPDNFVVQQQFFCGFITDVVDNVNDDSDSKTESDDRQSASIISGEDDDASPYSFMAPSGDFADGQKSGKILATRHAAICWDWLDARMRNLKYQEELLCQATHTDTAQGTEKWLADSGATCHITNSDTKMSNTNFVSVNVMVWQQKRS